MVIDAPGYQLRWRARNALRIVIAVIITMQQGIDWASSECFPPAASYACLQP
jgi:hypothetical protein